LVCAPLKHNHLNMKRNNISSPSQMKTSNSICNSIFKCLILISLVSLRPDVLAQTDSLGVYNTAEDFQNKKLSYSAPCKGGRNKIRMNQLFRRAFLTVRKNGKKFHIKADGVYGYRDCGNIDHRIVDGTDYSIVNTDRIYLYSTLVMGSGDSGYSEEWFYFSVQPTSKLLLLNKKNLINAYPDNEKFKRFIEVICGDYDVLDMYTKEYLIVKLYKDSLK